MIKLTDNSTFSALSSAFGVLDAAYTAFSIARDIKNIAQGTNNSTQEREISGLQGQPDSLVQIKDTIQSKTGTSFADTNSHFGPLEELKNVSLSTPFPSFDNKILRKRGVWKMDLFQIQQLVKNLPPTLNQF